ncbi:MAG: hypothetical protein AB8D78_14390, partial [Akkermansiaceae bacterium]
QDDLDSAPGLESTLKAAGISVIGLKPPSPAPKIHPLFHGYLYHQRKSLRFALDALPPGSYVLKARTDFAEERFDAMVEAIFDDDAIDSKTSLADPILESRLFTYDARPDHFFYWDDIVFSGTREDLVELNNFDISYEVLFPAHFFSAECSLYAPLFLSRYPLLRWFFENTNGKNFAEMVSKWVSSDTKQPLPELAIRILASYFHILSRYLILPEGHSKSGQPISLKSFFTPDEKIGVEAYPNPWPSHKLRSNTLLKILQKPECHITERTLSEIITMMNQMDGSPSLRGEIPENFEDLIQNFASFDENLGTSAYAPQYQRPEVSPSDIPVDISSLDSITLPEKRHLSWTESKVLGARRKMADFAFDKLL